jgi:putative transposase
MIEDAIVELTSIVGTTTALASVGADRATWYRKHRQSPVPERPERIATPQPRALSEVERKEIKRTLESNEFVDEAPATVFAKLLDQVARSRSTTARQPLNRAGTP